MKKKYRIKKAEEFTNIIKKGNKKANGNFVIYFCEKSESHPRFGISVGKKIGNAVERNKIKRQIRSIIREVDVSELHFDLIIIARFGYLKDEYRTNTTKLNNLIKEVEREYKNEY